MDAYIKKKFGRSLANSVASVVAAQEEAFGDGIVQSIRDFCADRLKTVADLEADEFAHITDAQLRATLARTYYGARWLYKLSLATLSLNDGDVEKSAHVRVQVIDYGSIAEAVLVDLVAHGVHQGHFAGTGYKTTKFHKKIVWAGSSSDHLNTARKQTFEWLIDVAHEEGAIDARLKSRLHKLRRNRNTVHITEGVVGGVAYYSGLATTAHNDMVGAIRQAKAWKVAHP